MDLDAMKLTVARLTDVERNRRYNEGLCYHCARPGHLMKNCPNVAGRSGRGTRGGRGSGNQRGGFGGFSGFGNQNQDHFNQGNGFNNGQNYGGNLGGFNGMQRRGGFRQQGRGSG